MTPPLPLSAVLFHMGGADLFGLIVALLALGYVFYAIVRGEKL